MLHENSAKCVLVMNPEEYTQAVRCVRSLVDGPDYSAAGFGSDVETKQSSSKRNN